MDAKSWLNLLWCWCWDWIRTAIRDPDFWSYRIVDLQLLRFRVDFWPGHIDITIDYWTRLELHHPIDQAGWQESYPVDYCYPIEPRHFPF